MSFRVCTVSCTEPGDRQTAGFLMSFASARSLRGRSIDNFFWLFAAASG
ncbi:hypothetical protein QT971_21150 [Microcoleus sp. herbarium19]